MAPTSTVHPSGASPGDLLAHVRLHGSSTRAELGRVSGLSRSAVAARVASLLDSGLLRTGHQTDTGGRPAETLTLSADAARVVALAVGRSRSQVGVFDLHGVERGSDSLEHADAGVGPATLLPDLARRAEALLDGSGAAVAGVGLSVPGAVDVATARVRESLVLPAWDGADLRAHLGPFADLPLVLGNDADVLASAELAVAGPGLRDALVLKASTGIGLGIVVDGRVAHGHRGAAGELGHVRVAAADGLPCRCGGTGCLETVAAGWALLEAHPAPDRPAHTRDLVEAARAGEPAARDLVRRGARHVGEALAAAVNLLNPEVVVVGGDMGGAFDLYAAALREAMWPRLAPTAARELRLEPSAAGAGAGLVGAATVVLDELLSPGSVDRWLGSGSTARPAPPSVPAP